MSAGDGREGIIRERMSRGRLSGKLAGLSLPKQIWTIAFWPFLEQLIGFCVTSAALFVATHMGSSVQDTKDLADGIGISTFIMMIGFTMQGAVGMGSTAIVSRATGARNYSEANHMACQAAVLGFIAGCLSTVFMIVASKILINHVFNMSDMAKVYASQFVGIAAFSAFFSGIIFAVNAALRGNGDTKLPFLIMMLVGVLDLTFILTFVYAPEPVGGWHIRGLAMASTCAFAVASFVLLFVLYRRKRRLVDQEEEYDDLEQFVRKKGEHYIPPIFLDRDSLVPRWKDQKRIIKIGVPQAIEVFGMNMIQLFCLTIISKLPYPGAVGVHNIAIRIESLSFLPGFAIGMAASALVGQYLGARNTLMARITILKCLKYAVTFMACAGAMFFLFPQFFMGIFAGNNADIINQGVPVLRVMLLLEPFFAANIVMKTALRGAGDTKRVMFLSYGIMGFFRVVLVLLWYCIIPSTMVLWGIWLLYAIEGMVQSVIFYKIVKGKSWLNKRV